MLLTATLITQSMIGSPYVQANVRIALIEKSIAECKTSIANSERIIAGIRKSEAEHAERMKQYEWLRKFIPPRKDD